MPQASPNNKESPQPKPTNEQMQQNTQEELKENTITRIRNEKEISDTEVVNTNHKMCENKKEKQMRQNPEETGENHKEDKNIENTTTVIPNSNKENMISADIQAERATRNSSKDNETKQFHKFSMKHRNTATTEIEVALITNMENNNEAEKITTSEENSQDKSQTALIKSTSVKNMNEAIIKETNLNNVSTEEENIPVENKPNDEVKKDTNFNYIKPEENISNNGTSTPDINSLLSKKIMSHAETGLEDKLSNLESECTKVTAEEVQKKLEKVPDTREPTNRAVRRGIG